MQKSWQQSKIISLFKKGYCNSCENYRGIGLINAAYKSYDRILNNWLKMTAESLLNEEQIGFVVENQPQMQLFYWSR